MHRQLKLKGLGYPVKDMLELLALLRQEPMPQKIPEYLEKLVRRYINCRCGTLWRVNQLLQHIKRSWDRISSDSIDRTNNATEQIIGLDYIRTETMRGFKSWQEALSHCYLSEYLRGGSYPDINFLTKFGKIGYNFCVD